MDLHTIILNHYYVNKLRKDRIAVCGVRKHITKDQNSLREVETLGKKSGNLIILSNFKVIVNKNLKIVTISQEKFMLSSGARWQ